MKKKEWVYRAILCGAMREKGRRFTQLSLAKGLKLSLSTVNNALAPLVKIGALEVGGMGFRVSDAEKILTYWASVRNLEKDISYKARVEAPVSEIERNMPPGIIYTAYSGYRFRFDDVPADYSEVYVYAEERALGGMWERFPDAGGKPNLFVLEADSALAELSEGNVAPGPQLYVDLWNLKEWYAKEFLKALGERFGW